MLIAHQVEAYLATFNEQKRVNEEEGFLFGHGDEPVRGICVCWMATDCFNNPQHTLAHCRWQRRASVDHTLKIRWNGCGVISKMRRRRCA